jgi:hypothetical protein
MICKNVVLTGKKWPKRFAATGDWHIGNAAVHTDGIEAFIERTALLDGWVHHSDIVESVLPKDKRFAISEHGNITLLGAWDEAVKYLRRAKRNCLGMLSGNHERTISADIGSVPAYLSAQAGIPYLTQTAILRLCGAERPVRWFVAHGSCTFVGRAGDPERVELNREIKLRDYLAAFVAEISGVGHGHRGVVSPPTEKLKITYDGAGTSAVRRPTAVKDGWNYMTPSMFRVYDYNESYAQQALYPPTDLGWIEWYLDRDGSIPRMDLVDENGEILLSKERKIVR